MERRQIDVLPLRLQYDRSFFRFLFFGRFQRIELFLPLNGRCDSHVFGRDRRSDNTAGRRHQCRDNNDASLHDNSRSSCLIRCST